MSMTKGTPASSQIIWLEDRVQKPEAENTELVHARDQALHIATFNKKEAEKKHVDLSQWRSRVPCSYTFRRRLNP